MQHIGFIMDGNRTWAQERGLPTLEGHRGGYENAKKIIRLTKERGIPYASFWALSDDNIRKRDARELQYLFELLATGMLDLAKDANKNNIRIRCVGDRSLLPGKCVKNMKMAEESTEENTGMIAIIALGYGGQEEIVRGIRSLMESGIPKEDITAEAFASHIETAVFPSVDLIVRTGGHIRHSGFLLFQSPYAEYYFSAKNWPDFGEADLDECIRDYEERTRKYGK